MELTTCSSLKACPQSETTHGSLSCQYDHPAKNPILFLYSSPLSPTMSLDIDWSLLSSSSSSASFTTQLIATLNTHLQSTSRPSFIGPISISAFDFGTQGPEIEIKDIRDVWRAFDDDDDDDIYPEEQERDRGTREQSFDSYESDVSRFLQPRGNYGPNGYGRQLDGRRDEDEYEILSPFEDEEEELDDEDGDDVSVFSGMSPRYSVAALGVGMGFGLAQGLARKQGSRLGGNNGQYRSRPNGNGHTGNGGYANGHGYGSRRPSRSISQSLFSPPGSRAPPPPYRNTQHQPSHSTHLPFSSSSPPVRARKQTSSSSSNSGGGIPPIQLHVNYSHTSDLTLTLLTSLQVNYPSPLFMSLPLKLCVTGLSIQADLILAYASNDRLTGSSKGVTSEGSRGKVHISINDEDPHSAIPVGQRIIPNVQIESEIGDGDVHVLRNVGKVERFIVEALRKTIVEELVFPNFQTVVL